MTDLRAPLRDERPDARDRRRSSGLFRAFWRWHFYASFLVVPVLLVLATTGLIYLFRFQIEPLLHPDLMNADQPSAASIRQPYAAQLAAVERAHPGAEVLSMAEPREEGRPTVFSVVTAAGEARDVYVNPYGAKVLGDLDLDATLSGTAVRLHAELMSGTLGDRVMELGACWAIVMALTGYYLLVKGRRARRRSRAPGARLRSRHAAVGSVVGIGLLMLLVSGLPWTGVFGERAQEIASGRGSSLWSTDPGAASDPHSTLDESLPHSHAHEVPWAQGGSEVPSSDGDGHERSVANLDTAVQVADGEGLRHPMTVALPAGDDGVFSVIGYAFDAPSDERTVHVDRYGGEVVSAYGFDDYPTLAKVVSQGIGLHEGRSLGHWSFWGSALMCVLVIVSCVTGPLMWWRRRPRGTGSLGAPRGRMPLRSSPLLALGIAALGVLLPLFGLSLLVVLALDQLVIRRVPALATFFGTA
ncbi:PepSY domain-containing protein [Nocardioides guangzhouensis]|uniref:PepSY domain-containing protein n=1 Tax=Nocardioides guangzhouensis TaxID=2497878 RepID=A0A4Q4Z5A7_9ACTN|nr:PepSY domain-containing protein [Nocardioides guangzhouensis]RYP82852.1 PepSY domain-containing protein [Nocardioides guangzhouensis]